MRRISTTEMPCSKVWLSLLLAHGQGLRRAALVDTVTLVNLVSQTRVVPEFLGPDCRPEPIAAALGALLTQAGAQAEAMDLTLQRLGRGGEAPGLRAARSVLERLAQ